MLSARVCKPVRVADDLLDDLGSDDDGDLDMVAGNLGEVAGSIVGQPNVVYFNQDVPAIYQILFTVSDGSLADTENVTITVTDVNLAP